jgi:tetratricopeptide (TPR) repeat protein
MAGALLAACHFHLSSRLYMFRLRDLLSLLLVMLIAGAANAQSVGKPAVDASARSATTLAESGHCPEALPSLRKSLVQVKNRELKRKIGLDGVRCAMTLHQTAAALEFLHVLTRDFPKDPDVLYVAIHAYSDLSTFTSQELAREAPSSYQAHELLAESYESQGKWSDAEKEYRTILNENPTLPGIHFRLGRALLSKPDSGPDLANAARQEFLQELQIDPKNAGAEYVLGELARQSQDWDEAVNHFSKASQLDPQFGEAFLGLGMSLIAAKHYPEALTPLETAVKLEPKNPNAHYNLALAYTRAGRKQEGDKEFAIHRSLVGSDGGPAPSSSQPQENER